MSRRTHPRFVLPLAVAAVGLAGTAGVALGTTTVGPVRFFPSGSPFAGLAPTPDSVGINPRGDVVVGQDQQSLNGTLTTATVRTRTGLRGPWGPAVVLAKPSGDTSAPQVAINARGDRIAVFRRIGRYVASRQRPTGWVLSGIGAPAPTTEDVTAIALTPGGRARFVQALPDTGCDPGPAACPWTVWVYDQPSAGAIWTRSDASLRIPPTQEPAIAVSGRGDVLVAWATPGTSGRVTASRRLASDAAFEAPLPVSDPGIRGDVHAAIGDSGDAAIGWVHPDTPGAAAGFTGRVDVAVRPDTLPVWATPETVVPAGAANPDLDLAIDASANVVLAWTTLPAAAGAPFTMDAAIRTAATSSWAPSPRLDTAAVGAGESVELRDVFAGAGRAFVIYEKRVDANTTLDRLAIGEGGGWTVHTLAGNVDPTAPGQPGPRPIAAVAPNGRLILAGTGLQVRNVDATRTPPAARATALAVTVTRRSAELRFRLNVRARVFVLRRSGTNFTRSGEYPPATFPAGDSRMKLGRLPVGRYLVGIGACSPSRGCSATTFVGFRIR